MLSFGKKVDGSISTKPLNALIACKLLGIRYEWQPNLVGEWSVVFNQEDIPEAYADELGVTLIETSKCTNGFKRKRQMLRFPKVVIFRKTVQ
ncbi:hypothetical protein FACS1894177_08570 [Bacteroidia bacterium]|nr:hypothetical protein FACS1894177_08570 [Bacteroidia bacterium]